MDEVNLDQKKVIVLPDGRLDRQNAARFLGYSPKTLADWQTKGLGPGSRMVGGRRFYDIDDLQNFAQGKANSGFANSLPSGVFSTLKRAG